MRRAALLAVFSLLLQAPASALDTIESLAARASLDLAAYPAQDVPAVREARAVRPQDERSAQPDWQYSPGLLCTSSDPDYAELRYAEGIPYCKRNVSDSKKDKVARHYGIAAADYSKYEFDHLIPVCAGGSSQVSNLWPQPRGDQEADGKDRLEELVCRKMREGKMKQAEAVQKIMDWFHAYMRGKLKTPAAAA